jgi:hypothetical protein
LLLTSENLGALLPESLDDTAKLRNRGRKVSGLLRPLGLHVLFLIVYAVIASVLAVLAGESFRLDPPETAGWWAGMMGFVWLLLVVAPLWLIVAALLIRWWWQERHGLVKGSLVSDSLLWLGLALAFLVVWKRTRPFLVPPKPKMIGTRGSTS